MLKYSERRIFAIGYSPIKNKRKFRIAKKVLFFALFTREVEKKICIIRRNAIFCKVVKVERISH